jgi:hypothetical protein
MLNNMNIKNIGTIKTVNSDGTITRIVSDENTHISMTNGTICINNNEDTDDFISTIDEYMGRTFDDSFNIERITQEEEPKANVANNNDDITANTIDIAMKKLQEALLAGDLDTAKQLTDIIAQLRKL